MLGKLPSKPELPHAKSWRIADIIVGERHRKDMGDIEGLVALMSELGLLHPIVVRPDGTLIAGERRLRAAQLLGWKDIPVNVVDIESIVRGECVENVCRKDFTPSELVAIGEDVEREERERAKERMTLGKVSTGSDTGKTRDKTAACLGISGRTYERAKAVVDAAKAAPKFGKLQEDMDRTGKVNGVFKRLQVAQQAELIRAEPPPLPGNGPYRVGTIDFPWPYEARQDDPSHRAARPYPTMSMEAIQRFAREQLAGIMHDDSLVWLWCTNLYLIRYAAPVLDALGLSERSILTWVKTNFGTGDWLRSQTEHAVLAIRGKPTVTLTNESTVLFAPARGHSAKPVEFYELVERLLRVGWIALAPLGQWSILMGWPCQCKPAEPTP